MILLFDPDHALNGRRDHSLRKAEEYELQRALRDADEQARAERKQARAERKATGAGHTRHYLRLFGRRSAPIPR